MKRQMRVFLLAATCGAFLATGCAKHEMVKSDAALAPAAGTTAGKPAQDAAKSAAAQQPVEQKLTATDAKMETKTLQPANEADALQRGLEKVYFDFDSTTLSEQARNVLVKNAELLKKSPKSKIRVEGNCDERGSDDYNLALGEKRAKEAVQYLTNLGISPQQLTSVSYGKEKPAVAGHDNDSWAKNRRDEFVVIP